MQCNKKEKEVVTMVVGGVRMYLNSPPHFGLSVYDIVCSWGCEPIFLTHSLMIGIDTNPRAPTLPVMVGTPLPLDGEGYQLPQ